MKHTLLYGIFTGLLLSAWILIENYAGFQTSAVGNWSSYMLVPLLILGLYLGIRRFRDYDNGGYITYGRAVYGGMLISLYAAILLAVFAWLYFQYVNPDYVELMVETNRRLLAEKGLSDAEITKGAELTRNHFSPATLAKNYFGAVVFSGLLFSVILAAFLKRKPADAGTDF